jgi:high affinity sulfate transporter 1
LAIATRGSSTRWGTLSDAVPILRWLPAYRRSRLRGDVLAGAIVAALLVPQSLGYARIAGVPVETGLYAVPLALLAYAVLGSSPQLIVGPASTVAIVSGSLVADIARDNPGDAVAITSALAIAAGIVLAAIGLLRVSWLAEFLSKPIVTGFVFGLTLTIVIGELPTLLGIPKPPGDLIGVLVRTIQSVDEANLATASVGGLALLFLFGGRRLAPHVPWGLVVLVAGVAASRVFNLEAEGVAVIGDVPGGLPPLGLPLIPRDDLGAVVVGGVSLALVALAEGLAATRLFATRGGYRVETERELVGMGASNVAAGLSGGLAVAGSLSKTAAAEQAGSRSQVSGMTAAGIVVIVLIAFTWLFEDLPQSVLSAIVVAAVWGLMDVAALRRYYRVRRADFVAAVVGTAAVVLFGPLPGLGIAIVVSLLAIIYRSSRPRIEVLGKIGDEKAAWGRIRGHPDRRPVTGVVVVRLDAPLFWANAAAIEERLVAEVGKWESTRALVLDLEATTQLDTTAADTVEHLYGQLEALDVQLYLARVLHRVEHVLERSGFLAQLGSEHIWHSISQCVRAAKRHIAATDQEGVTPDAGAEPDILAEPETISAAELSATVARKTVADASTKLEMVSAADASAEPEKDPARDVDTEPVSGPSVPTTTLEDDDEVEAIADDTDVSSSFYPGGSGDRRDNALALYLLAVRDGHPRAAASAYTGARLVQHSTGVRDGADGFVEFFEPFIERNPVRYVRIVRSIEDGRLVFLQVFLSLNHGESEWVSTDFFDTDSDDRVIEHWDVVARYTGPIESGRSAIDGPTEISDLDRTDENKAIVRKMIKKVLLPGGKPARVDRYFLDNYVRHNDELADGVRSFHDLAASPDALVYDKIVLLVGEGSFVATLCRVRKGDVEYAQTDIFRLQHGLIVEHWGNSEVVPPKEQWVNSGKF